MRLIDADKLIEDYTQPFADSYGKSCAEMFVGVVKQTPTVDIIEELEKIKEEINEEEEKGIYYECEEWGEGRPYDEDYFFGLLRAIMIIDKHIFELKGGEE